MVLRIIVDVDFPESTDEPNAAAKLAVNSMFIRGGKPFALCNDHGATLTWLERAREAVMHAAQRPTVPLVTPASFMPPPNGRIPPRG